MFLGSFIPGAQFISFTKVNPGHRQYCGCDAHEYGARWIPLAPWQEVGSGLTQQSYQRPDKSESHEAYENQMLSVVFDDFFWACHNLNTQKKNNIWRCPKHQWPCCTWECIRFSIATLDSLQVCTCTILYVQFTPWKINGWNLKITCLKREIIFQTSIFGFDVNFQGCIR